MCSPPDTVRCTPSSGPRPMVTRSLNFAGGDMDAHARLAAAIESTPADAVVRLRVIGAVPAMLSAAVLRGIAGARTVTLAVDSRLRTG